MTSLTPVICFSHDTSVPLHLFLSVPPDSQNWISVPLKPFEDFKDFKGSFKRISSDAQRQKVETKPCQTACRLRMKVEVVKMQLSLSFRHETGRSRGYYILPFLPYSSPLFSSLPFATLLYSSLLLFIPCYSSPFCTSLLFSPLFYTSLLYSTLPCSFLLFSAVVCSSVFSSFLHSALLKSPKHDFSPKLPLLTLHMFDFN